MTGIPSPLLSSAFRRPWKTHLFYPSPTRAAKERWGAWELKLLHSLIALITIPAAGLLADFGRDHFCLSRSTLHRPTCCKSWSTYTQQISRGLLQAKEQCWIQEKNNLKAATESGADSWPSLVYASASRCTRTPPLALPYSHVKKRNTYEAVRVLKRATHKQMQANSQSEIWRVDKTVRNGSYTEQAAWNKVLNFQSLSDDIDPVQWGGQWPSKRKHSTTYTVASMEGFWKLQHLRITGKTGAEGNGKGAWRMGKTRKRNTGRNAWASTVEQRGRNICSQHRLKKVHRFHAKATPHVKDITGPLAPAQLDFQIQRTEEKFYHQKRQFLNILPA